MAGRQASPGWPQLPHTAAWTHPPVSPGADLEGPLPSACLVHEALSCLFPEWPDLLRQCLRLPSLGLLPVPPQSLGTARLWAVALASWLNWRCSGLVHMKDGPQGLLRLQAQMPFPNVTPQSCYTSRAGQANPVKAVSPLDGKLKQQHHVLVLTATCSSTTTNI